MIKLINLNLSCTAQIYTHSPGTDKNVFKTLNNFKTWEK